MLRSQLLVPQNRDFRVRTPTERRLHERLGPQKNRHTCRSSSESPSSHRFFRRCCWKASSIRCHRCRPTPEFASNLLCCSVERPKLRHTGERQKTLFWGVWRSEGHQVEEHQTVTSPNERYERTRGTGPKSLVFEGCMMQGCHHFGGGHGVDLLVQAVEFRCTWRS